MLEIEEFLGRELFEVGSYRLSVGNLIGAGVLLLLGILCNYAVSLTLRRYARRSQNLKHQGQLQIINQLKTYLLTVVTLLLVLQSVGVNLSLLIASSAALLVGVGLGIQGIVANFTNGLSLMFGKTISINDVVLLEGTLGRIQRIGFRTTEIITPLDQSLLIPNSKLIEMTVQNLTHRGTQSGFAISIGVAYGTDMDLAREILLRCARESKQVLNTPAPQVFCVDFGESSVDLQLRIWVQESFRIEGVKSALRFRILEEFTKARVEIPFPQRVVELKKDQSAD